MFDRVAGTYDLLNKLLSGGIDRRWRRVLCRHLPPDPEKLRVLDLATGTADQLLAVLERAGPGRIQSALGLDPAEKMLAVGRKKLADGGWDVTAGLRKGDAMAIDAPDGAFDVVTMSFGIRNVPDPQAALREIHRVLAPGGRALILEFSLPSVRVLRWLYLIYFRHILPRVGGWVSGEHDAYRYLNRTVEDFPYGAAFLEWLREAGFRERAMTPLTFGIATIYRGDKNQSPQSPC